MNGKWQNLHVTLGCVQSSGMSSSVMISLWVDQTILMASGVPIPAPRVSPAGPNQWFWGAPVVRAKIRTYVYC